MGAIADAMVAYAQPMLDQTDGSMEQMNEAFQISLLCYNLALLREEDQDAQIREMQSSLNMDGDEFAAFRHSIIDPMIRRHHEMFPLMGQRFAASNNTTSLGTLPTRPAPADAYPETDRYAPCHCNSGKKYKFCCGAPLIDTKDVSRPGET